MKQEDLANEINKSLSLVNKIVNGKRRPSYDVAKEIAAATKTGVDLWMDGEAADKKAALKAA